MSQTASTIVEDSQAAFASAPLPDGWQLVRLGDVCTVKGGKRLPAGADFAKGLTPFPYIRVVDFSNGTVRTDSLKYLEAHTQKQIERYIISKHDVYISIAGSIGIVGVVPDELDGANLTENAARLIILDETHLARDFLSLFLLSPNGQQSIRLKTNKVGQPKLALERIEKIEIPLPPLTEQKRIAAILKEQIATVEQARAAAEAQLKAAKDLPAAYMRAVFNSPESQTWEKNRLGDVCEFVGGMQPPAHTFKRQPQSGYIRLVQIQDFRRDDLAVYIPAEEAKRSFDETDVMIGRYGPPVFQILRGLSGAYNVALMKTVPKAGLLKDFLYFLLQEHSIQSAVIGQSERSAGQSGVQKEFLENFRVKIPPVEEQARIAAILKEQMTQAKQIRQILQEQVNSISDLPAILLRQAFTGKL